ncbi:MAG: hypothetical protein B6D59_01480 [Campylobacteraceae bacterium 4484_4]|nr:MAG: hypothetical protein B6D59_01480 [Campylobacteraceae bacterium 4484_4]
MRFIDKNFKKPLALYIVMGFLSLFLLFYFYNLKIITRENFVFHQDLGMLQLLDKDLNLFIRDKADYLNFDQAIKLTNRFEKHLEKIQRDEAYLKISKDPLIVRDLSAIKSTYTEKRDLIERYKSRIAIANNSMRYLPVLLQELESFGNQRVGKTAQMLYERISQYAFGEDLDHPVFARLLRQLEQYGDTLPMDQKKIVHLYKAHISLISETIRSLHQIERDLSHIHLDEKITRFSKRAHTHLIQKMEEAVTIDFLMIMMLLLFTLASGLLYYRRIRSENELKIFKEGVDKSDNAIILTDPDHTITYVNRAFEKSTGYSAKEAIGNRPSILKSGMLDPSFYQELAKEIREKKRWFGEFINRRKDGSVFYEKASIIPIMDEKGELLSYMAIKLDITQEKLYQASIQKKNEEIYEKHYFDQLTHLPNRNKLLEDLEQSERQRTLLLFNIDDFQQINDFYGIHAGDNILIKFAQIMIEVSLSYPKQFYRMHADEFALLIDAHCSREEIGALISQLEANISRASFFVSLQQQISFTFSTGISFTGKGSKNAQTILIEADLALKYAKKSSFSYAIYEPSMQIAPDYEKNLQWLTRLREAIEEDRIEPWFQPIIDRKSGEIYSYESLIRMIDTAGAPISPFFFLDIAKKAKLYVPLTKLMIRKSFEKFAQNDYRFSLNFSFEDMADEGVVKYLTQQLSQLPHPERFTAEILESESITNYDITREFISRLKRYGCKIAIDDFGSGYSNFERIFQLGADYLKIDGSIIKHIDENEQMRIITETIVSFGHKSNMNIVAEFVHSGEIADLLEKMGVTLMQGFYFAPPGPDLDPKMVLENEEIKPETTPA